MIYLSDTGIILRLVNTNDSLHQIVTQSIQTLEQRGDELVVIPQILVEFWTVATRPINVNGFGMTTESAEVELVKLQKLFHLLPENERIFEEWKRIVVRYKVSGKTTHDARIAAAMVAHGITHILTLNPGDFKRYTEISAITPQEILGHTN